MRTPPSASALPPVTSRGAARSARALPSWPLTAGVAGYPFWWLLGLGDLIWPALAAVMTVYLIVRLRRRVRVPRGFGLWLLFLVWMAVSVVQVDTFGRLLGFMFRASLYVAATVIFIYVYNARTSITKDTIARLASQFLAIMTVGGFLGIITPLLSVRTPLAYMLPARLRQNEFVHEMVIRRVTQYDPNAWAPGAPRPSAPFVYTNGWGLAYAIVFPIALAYTFESRGKRRIRWLLPTVILSTVPAFLTLNRGMFIGLGLALAYVLLRAIIFHNVRLLVAAVAIATVAGVTFFALPSNERLGERLETSSSTENRLDLYIETVERAAESPIIGFGAPRPSEIAGMPPAGTQGQFWSIIFSHGFGAAIPFWGWFAVVLRFAWKRSDPVGVAMGSAMLGTAVMTIFYGVLNAALVVIFMIAGIVMRATSDATDTQASPIEAD